jgi:hypothetical protein
MDKWLGPRPTDRLLVVVCSVGIFAGLGFLPDFGPWWELIRLMTGDPTAPSFPSLASTALGFATMAVAAGFPAERILTAYGVRLTRLPDDGRDYRELDRPTPPDGPP